MAALQASNITKEVVAPIKQFGESVWSLVSKAPTYAPIFPGGQSMQSMQNIASQISWTISSRQSQRATSFIDKNLPYFSSVSWKIDNLHNEFRKYVNNWKIIDPKNAYNKMLEQLKLVKFEEIRSHKSLVEDLKLASWVKEIKNDADLKKALNEFAKNANKQWINIPQRWLDHDVSKDDFNSWQKFWWTSVTWSQQTTQKVEVKYKEGTNIPIRLELWNWQKIYLENDGKTINQASLDEVARLINWKTREDIQEFLNNNWLDPYFKVDDIINQIKNWLWKDVLKTETKKEDGKNITRFVIDLSKKDN